MKIVFTLLMAAWGCILQAQLPYLSHEDGKVELIVDGQPFLMLCGELSNSATGSTHLMAPVWQRIADKNLNSVLAAMSWELVEPKEGQRVCILTAPLLYFPKTHVASFILVDMVVESSAYISLSMVI